MIDTVLRCDIAARLLALHMANPEWREPLAAVAVSFELYDEARQILGIDAGKEACSDILEVPAGGVVDDVECDDTYKNPATPPAPDSGNR